MAISTPEKIEEKRKDNAKQLRMSYARLFASEDGRRIMDDLKRRYGWQNDVELPCYQPNMTNNDFIHREGMREPIRYILRQMAKKTEE